MLATPVQMNRILIRGVGMVEAGDLCREQFGIGRGNERRHAMKKLPRFKWFHQRAA